MRLAVRAWGGTTRYLQMRSKAGPRLYRPQQALFLRRRLREAKSLLVDSTRSVTEIAYACGFGDYKQMAVHLRRDCGQTATAFRKARRGFPDRSGVSFSKGACRARVELTVTEFRGLVGGMKIGFNHLRGKG